MSPPDRAGFLQGSRRLDRILFGVDLSGQKLWRLLLKFLHMLSLKMPTESFFRFPFLKNEESVGVAQIRVESVGQAPGFLTGFFGHPQGELPGLFPVFGFDGDGSCDNDPIVFLLSGLVYIVIGSLLDSPLFSMTQSFNDSIPQWFNGSILPAAHAVSLLL